MIGGISDEKGGGYCKNGADLCACGVACLPVIVLYQPLRRRRRIHVYAADGRGGKGTAL